MLAIKRILLLITIATLTSCSATKPSDISYEVYGQAQAGKPALVLVHGWMGQKEIWQAQVDTFKNDYQVITLDLAGHGQSKARRDEYTMAAFGQDVAKVVKAVGAKKVILVGHSMGGPVVLEAAELLGDRVVGIVGVDTFYTPFQYPQDEATIQKFAQPFKDDFTKSTLGMVQGMFGPAAPQQLKDEIAKGVQKADKTIGVNALIHLFRWKMSRNHPLLKKYNDKILNINGNPDGTRQATHPSVVLINETLHFPAQSKPEEFNQVLRNFVAKR